MKRFLVLAVSVLAAAARAENVRLVVETATHTFFTAHVRNEGRALPGLGLVCSVEGTSVTLVGALPSIAPGEAREVTVSASNDLAGVRTLTGARQTRCRAVSWDEAASPSAGAWSGVVEFP